MWARATRLDATVAGGGGRDGLLLSATQASQGASDDHSGATAHRPTLVDEAARPNTEAISPLPRASRLDTPTARLATPSSPHPHPPPPANTRPAPHLPPCTPASSV